MTTIAMKDGVIAYDSLCVAGGSICSSIMPKHEVVKRASNYHIFYAGDAGMHEQLVDLYNNHVGHENPGLEGAAFIFKQAAWPEIYYCDFTGGRLVSKLLCNNHEFYALGSGQHHALTAMDLGYSAYEAVEAAMMRDIYTGGDINEFHIEQELRGEA